MFKNRVLGVCATAALCGALVASSGCKKKEADKPAAPAAAADKAAAAGEAVKAPEPPPPPLADIDLVAGDNIAGWVSLQSLDAAFNSTDALGAKLGLTPPGGQTKDTALKQLTAMLAGQVSGLEWLDTGKAVHVAFQDDAGKPAPDVAPDPLAKAAGAVVVLHALDKAKAVAAFTTAKKGPEADGHELKVVVGDKALFVDFIGNAVVFTIDKDRFAKVKGFVERLDKVAVPSLLYVGISVEDLVKTRGPEIEAFLTQLTAMYKDMPANPAVPNQAALMDMYGTMLRGWINDMRRVEFLIGADVNNTHFEVRLTAKDGTKLSKHLSAGKGRSPKDIINLLPTNSYLTFGASMDPAAQLDQLDESLQMVKDLLKLDDAAFAAFKADVAQVAKLQDGNSAVALYADGTMPLGMLVVAGSTDGDTTVKLAKRLVAAVLLKVIADQEAQEKKAGKEPAADDAEMVKVAKQALTDLKIQPLIDKFGTKMVEKGVTLTANTAKDGDVTCDTLDITFDWAKIEDPSDKDEQAEAVIGKKVSTSLCANKGKIAFSFGPGALEIAKHAAQAKVTGLTDAPVYKAAAAAAPQHCWLMYVNPGAALSAWKVLGPQVPQLSGDKAATLNCANHVRSFACGVDVPVELILSIKKLADAGSAPAAPVAPAPVAPAPGGPLGAAPAAVPGK